MKKNRSKRARKTDKVYYPAGQNNFNEEDGGDETMENEETQDLNNIGIDNVVLDEDEEFVPHNDLKNFEDFEKDFERGVSYFEIYRKDPYSNNNVFKERLEERPEEGWQVYIQKRFVDTMERPAESKWVVHLKNGVSVVSGKRYPKKSSPVFAVSPSPEILEQLKVLKALGGANNLIYQNNPSNPNPSPEKDRLTVLAEAHVAKTIEKALTSDSDKKEEKTSLVDEIKALKEAISVLAPPPQQPEEKTSFKEMFNENVSMLQSLASLMGNNKKDDTSMVKMLEIQLATAKEINDTKLRHEREMAELRLQQQNSGGDDIFGKIEKLEDLTAAAEKLGYVKDNGTGPKESPWIPVVMEIAKQAMPVLGAAVSVLGNAIMKPKQNGNMQMQPMPNPNMQIPIQQPQPQPNIEQQAQPQVQPTPQNENVVMLNKFAEQIKEMGFDDLSLMGFLNSVKISYFHKLDLLDKKLEESTNDDLGIVYDGIVDVMETVPVINTKFESVTSKRELEDYVHNVFVLLANNPIVQRFVKIGDMLASPQGQMWLTKFENYISSIYFSEVPTEQNQENKENNG